MSETDRRGYVPEDIKEFAGEQILLLQQAQAHIAYLLDHGYSLERSVTFVGDRFQFSARQRAALTRATAALAAVEDRTARCLGSFAEHTLHIDGFNLIITLEAALSPGTTLLRCMDNTLRDLCGLHGSYRIMDKTTPALELLVRALKEGEVAGAVFYLDSPVSNSGRLRQTILASMADAGIPARAELVPSADALLWDKDAVISSDAIILDRCASWVNLAAKILQAYLPQRQVVDLSLSN